MVDASREQGSPPVLAALVAPHSVQEFLADYWPDKPLLVHGDPSRLPAFLRAPELSGIGTLSRAYRGRISFTAGRKYHIMLPGDAGDAASLYRMGLTVMFDNIAPCIPATHANLRRLEAELGLKPGDARASVFASPPGEGLGVHFDSYAVISVQLQGSKRFYYAPVSELPDPVGVQFAPKTEPFDDLYAQIRDRFPEPDMAAFQCADMQPGSVLFLPRGYWHHTELDNDSVSVSIVLSARSAVDLILGQLRLLLLQDPSWRASLPPDARSASRVANLIARLPQLAQQLSVQEVLRNILPVEQRMASISARDRFQKVPHAKLHLEAGLSPVVEPAAWITVAVLETPHADYAHRRVQVPRVTVPVFSWIAQQTKAFRARDLSAKFTDLPFSQHQRILQVAVATGLIRLLWFAEFEPGSTQASTRQSAQAD
jgi:ribosomal protein L16 Arg81 hydroxylase